MQDTSDQPADKPADKPAEKQWDTYQNNPQFEHAGCPSAGRHEFLVSKIAAGSRVLNVGVGHGNLERLLRDQGCNVSAVDPSKDSIQKLSDLLGDDAKVGSADALPFADQTFDVVVLTEVLEHLPDDVMHGAVAEAQRVLQQGGVFLGTVPAEEILERGLVVCPKCGDSFHRWGHVQSFDTQRLTAVLSQNFSTIKVTRTVFDDPAKLNWKGKLVHSLRTLQAKLNQPASLQNFYFEAR